MNNKHIISTSTLIALLLLNTQTAYARHENETNGTEPVITDVQEETIENDDIKLEEQSLNETELDDTDNQEQDTELSSISLPNEKNNELQEALESETDKENPEEKISPASSNKTPQAQLQNIKSAEDYLKDYANTYYVSDFWNISQAFKDAHPNHESLSEMINDAAIMNMKEGLRVHRNKSFELASVYYSRALNEELVSIETRELAAFYLSHSNNNSLLKTPDQYVEEYEEANLVSKKWAIAQEFSAVYPEDNRISAIINNAATLNLTEGQRVHLQSDYDRAVIYYNRVLSEDLLTATLKQQVNTLVGLAQSEMKFKTSNEYYREYSETFFVSAKWQLAQEYKVLYPNESRVGEVINDAANANVTEGQRAHLQGNFDLAMIYYSRVQKESLINTELRNKTLQLLELAELNVKLKTADEFYNEYLDTYYVSDQWRIAQEFKKVYPNDIRVLEVVNMAAHNTLQEGIRAHNQKDYKRALIYYNRIINEDLLNTAILERVKLNIVYAETNRPIKSISSFVVEYKKAYYVSDKWNIAKEFKTLHPESKEAAEAMNDAASNSLKEGRNAQRRGDNERAHIYYSRVLSEEISDESTRYLASVFLNQTSNTHTPVIYIDAGHGGTDPGASHYGVYEKVLNLNVSNYLKNELENRGYIVLMSREVDKFVELSDRPFEANDLNVDAFISVHHNSMGGNGAARGLETFIFHRVDSGFGQETNRDNFKTDQPRISESLILADLIHSNLVRNTGLNNRGVKGNNFNVLRNSYAPAVLLELGFMDNRTELSLINTKAYQQQAARSVAVGIDNYFKGIN